MSKTKKVLIISIAAIILFTAVFVVISSLSNNDLSVDEQLQLAYKLFDEGKYEEAVLAFNKVISIDNKNIDARIGLSKVYVKTEEYEKAEEILNEALEVKKDSKEAYSQLIEIYQIQNRYDDLNKLIKDLEGVGLESEADRIRPDKPVATTESGTYNTPLSVALTAENDMFFTMDGTEPTIASEKYTTEIILNKNGIYQIKAFALDNRGIKSRTAVYTYTIELSKPAIPTASVPSGQYARAQTITLKNPNAGGTLYYSINGKEPTVKYSGAIKLEKTTTLKARVVDDVTSQKSDIATFNYTINIPTPTPEPAAEQQQPAVQNNSSPFFDVTVQTGTGYTMKRFFSDLFGFDVESSYMRGVGIAVDESAWNKEVSESVWNTWIQWRKEKYGY